MAYYSLLLRADAARLASIMPGDSVKAYKTALKELLDGAGDDENEIAGAIEDA